MPQDVVYEYVVATILKEIHSLSVTCDSSIIDAFEYQLPPKISIEKVVKYIFLSKRAW